MVRERKYWFLKNPIVVLLGLLGVALLLYVPIAYATTLPLTKGVSDSPSATKNPIVSVPKTIEQLEIEKEEQYQSRYRLDVTKVKSQRDELTQQNQQLQQELEGLKQELEIKQSEVEKTQQELNKTKKDLKQAQVSKANRAKQKGTSTGVPSANNTKASGKTFNAVATAYTPYCKGCSGTSAYGIDLRANPNAKVIAVDPKVIPLGSKVEVFYNGSSMGVYVAGDTGGAIKGHKIDILMPTKSKAYDWGRRTVTVKVL